MSQRPHPDLRILTDLDNSSSSEQGLTRMFLLSPSVLAVGAFLEDIDDPQRLLHETAAPPPPTLECEVPPVPVAAVQGPGAQSETKTTKNLSAGGLFERALVERGDEDDGGAHEHTVVEAKNARMSIQDAATTHNPTLPRRGGGGGKRRKTALRAPAAEQNAEAPEKRGAMVNPSRDRLKEELVYLKGKASNLERELQRLQTKPSSSVAAVMAATIRQPNAKPSHLFPRRPIWERLANGAKDRKRSSELENDRLRETIKGQAKLSNTLERMFMKAANVSTSDPLLCSVSSRAPSVQVHPSSAVNEDDRVFQELMSQLDLQYQHLNIVQSETGLAQRTREGQMSEIRNTPMSSGDGTLMIECCDVKHFPFAMDAVADAGWRCMTMELIKDVNYTAEVVHKTDNFALTKSTVTMRKFNEPDRVLGAKNVMKRFSEQHRRVLLFNSVTNLSSRATSSSNQEDSYKSTDSGLQFSDQGWATIESASDNSRWPACVLRICIRVRLQEQLAGGASRDTIALDSLALSELLAGTYIQVLRARHQIVENFVLEDLIAHRL